ncbi:hypothetical protein RRG08_057995 [Elysia crispata]|uniref:Uncharacterized protein n=1 Tax=Elysia crispata TaxID=231223 RepID=A0AAE1DXK2_9GAST|nr:hypothetical protein RRG08_057995 [Elysia crispata]
MPITCIITWGGVSSSNLYLPYANHVCYHMGWSLQVKPLSSLCQSRVLSHGVESPAPTSIFPMLITCVITWGGVSSSNLYLPYANHVCYHMGWSLQVKPLSSLCQSRVLSHAVESPAPSSIFPMPITCVITWGGVSR